MYDQLSDDNKKKLIQKEYIQNKKSFYTIAEEAGTYANKVRRDAKRLGISVRNKSEAQSNAIATGSHKHPTKGQKRSESIKQKIGMSIYENWQNLSDSELQQRKNKARENWDKKTHDEKQDLISKANKAVRESSKTGSKLEKYLLARLLENNFKVDFHKEHLLSNTKLQLDLFLPEANVAIEVDGPSHFENIWGDKALQRNTKYDQKKEGILAGKGIRLIRLKQDGDFSKSRASVLFDKLIHAIHTIKNTTGTIYLNY